MLSAGSRSLLPLAMALATLWIPSPSSARLMEARTGLDEVASHDRAGAHSGLALGSYWRKLSLGADVASESSKFLQTDPAGFIDGPNLYTAFANDPVNMGDPSGMRARTLAELRRDTQLLPPLKPVEYGVSYRGWLVEHPERPFVPDLRPDSPPEAMAYGAAGAVADIAIGSTNLSAALAFGGPGIIAHSLGFNMIPYSGEWMPFAGDEAYEDAYLATGIGVGVVGAMLGGGGASARLTPARARPTTPRAAGTWVRAGRSGGWYWEPQPVTPAAPRATPWRAPTRSGGTILEGESWVARPWVRPGSQAHHLPGWTKAWEWRYPEGTSKANPRWFDPKGGEWRWHPADKWHAEGHWDYNPWTQWNSPWQNIPNKP